MDTILTFLTALNSLSPLAVVALALLVLGLQIRQSKKLHKIETNDLHELPLLLPALQQMNETLQRIEVKMGEEFSYIRARLNGKH